jgi:hypothetical protein
MQDEAEVVVGGGEREGEGEGKGRGDGDLIKEGALVGASMDAAAESSRLCPFVGAAGHKDEDEDVVEEEEQVADEDGTEEDQNKADP